MIQSVIFTTLLAAASQATVLRRFTDGSNPSGTVPSDTIKDCTYWVNVQSGDTCSSITSGEGVKQADFIKWNPSLKSDCSGLKVGYSYCIEENYGLGPATTTTTSTTSTSPTPTSTKPSPTQSGLASDCNDFYKVVSGDECGKISDKYHIALSDFYKWNPAVKTDCTGLQAGYYVCVSVPGATHVPTTTTATSTATGPSPTQSGINPKCTKYAQPQSGQGCYDMATAYGITTDQFYAWNPAVGTDCSKLYAGYYYCVGAPSSTTTTTKPATTTTTPTGPSPTQSGITKDCTKYYKAVSGDSCYNIANKFGTFSQSQFINWNPAVQSDCSKLFVDYYYCVAVPGTPTTRTSASPTPTQTGPQPQQPNTTKNCKKYYKVVDGDYCQSIEQKFGITATQFNSWNPDVGSDCAHLFKDYYVCVGV